MNSRNPTKIRQTARAFSILARLLHAHQGVSGQSLAKASCALLDEELEPGVDEDVLKVATRVRDLRTPPSLFGSMPRRPPEWRTFRLSEYDGDPDLSPDGLAALKSVRGSL